MTPASPKQLNRRQALGALGAVSLGGLLAACGDDDSTSRAVTSSTGATSTVETKTSTSGSVAEFDSSGTCTVAAELTEGPFYFDVDSIRSDLREDREGTLLRLGIRVRDAGSCEPIENAIVDVWHCDALGAYSGFESASTRGGGPGGASRSDDETYLRGAQATNSEGIVEFKTIYPGWYRGRTTHIHLKVHLDKQTVLTSQLFTTEDFDASVYGGEPYSEETGRDTYNDGDSIYAESGELTLSMVDGDAVRGLITLDVERA